MLQAVSWGQTQGEPRQTDARPRHCQGCPDPFPGSSWQSCFSCRAFSVTLAFSKHLGCLGLCFPREGECPCGCGSGVLCPALPCSHFAVAESAMSDVQLGDLVVRPRRRLFSVVTSTSVVLKCFCNAKALILLEECLHSSRT